MKSSESLKEFAPAFAKAQPEIEGAIADKQNPHFRSKYADLGNVVDAIKPALANFGLSFVQACHDADNAAKVETIILHSSGEWLSCGAVSVPVSKQDAQGYGSALTYARRYSLAAAFGVAPEDDDGNAAAKAAPKPAPKAPNRPQETPKPATPPAGTDTPAQKLLTELAEFCGGVEDMMEVALKDHSGFEGKDGIKSLSLDRLKNPPKMDAAAQQRFDKWVNKTRDSIKKAKESARAEMCAECRQPIVNKACGCPPF